MDTLGISSSGLVDPTLPLPAAATEPEPDAAERGREATVRGAVTTVLGELVIQFSQGGPDSARTLRQIGLVTRASQNLFAALRGQSPLTSRRGLMLGDSADDYVPEVESAGGAGIYSGNVGGMAQQMENHGARVINELLALGRAHVASQSRPKLDELMRAIYRADEHGDTATAAALRQKMRDDFGIESGPSPGFPTADAAADPDAGRLDADYEEAGPAAPTVASTDGGSL